MKSKKLIWSLSTVAAILLGISITASTISVFAVDPDLANTKDSTVRANFGKLMSHSIFNPLDPKTKVENPVTPENFHQITGQQGPLTLDEIPSRFDFGEKENADFTQTFKIPSTNWPTQTAAQPSMFAVQVSDFQVSGGYSLLAKATTFEEVDDSGKILTNGKIINGGILTIPSPNLVVRWEVPGELFTKEQNTGIAPDAGTLDVSGKEKTPAKNPTIIYAGSGDSNPLLTGRGKRTLLDSTGKGSWTALYNPKDITLNFPNGVIEDGNYVSTLTWILVTRLPEQG